MDSVFIWAQIIGLIAMAVSVWAWQLKKPRHIILCNVPATLIWTVQYILLGAPLGAILNLASAFKDSGLFFIKNKYVPYLIGTFLLVIWSTGLYFFEHWYDSLPLISGSIMNIALLQRDNRSLIARATIICCLFWLVYNVIVSSWMGAACASMVITSSIIGMARHEEWSLGKCYKSFFPSLSRSLFVFPNLQTYP